MKKAILCGELGQERLGSKRDTDFVEGPWESVRMFIQNLRDLFVEIVTVWESQSDNDVFQVIYSCRNKCMTT
jgi:hypothetical protein